MIAMVARVYRVDGGERGHVLLNPPALLEGYKTAQQILDGESRSPTMRLNHTQSLDEQEDPEQHHLV